jgi:hypothetical protein
LIAEFGYIVTDAEGDISRSLLQFRIAGQNDGVRIEVIDSGLSVDEAYLVEGGSAGNTDPEDSHLVQRGSFRITAVDGLAFLEVHDVRFTVEELEDSHDTPLVVTTALGNELRIIGYVDGVVEYTYRLVESVLHGGASS